MLVAIEACAAPMPAVDVLDASDATEPVDVVENDVVEFDATANDTPDPPADVPNGIDVPNRDVPNRDAPNARDVPSTPPCQLDPFNCGMCGRVCSMGTPACAEVQPNQWNCVNNCGGFGRGCLYPDGGSVCCPGFACGPDSIGCR